MDCSGLTESEILVLEYSRCTSNANTIDLNATSMSEEIDVGS